MNAALHALRQRAQAALQAGNLAEAAHVFDYALVQFPNDGALWNSAGNVAMQRADVHGAVRCFAQAWKLVPSSAEFLVNYAISLGQVGAHEDAHSLLRAHEALGSGQVRYCSVRATTARQVSNLDEAAYWYDEALRREAHHKRALSGRARVALERAEPDAVARFDRAIAVSSGDPDLWLGKAQALESAGAMREAFDIAASLCRHAPTWIDALRFLAQLKLANGDEDFSAPFREAAAAAPDDPGIPVAHCAVLAGFDKFSEAADVASQAHKRFADMDQFALLEAVHAGEAGQNERAEAIWSALRLESAERDLHEARHRLRQHKPERADWLLERVLAREPSNISAWALRGVSWRLLDDHRKEWLHDQMGLVQFLPLQANDAVLDDAVAALNALHDRSAHPLCQSLRGGTQTRGGLFDRTEPVFAWLRDAILATVEDYRAALPPTDASHPLLRHCDSAWSITGSWSVRLSGGGDFHTSHIHPQGIVSSALYLELSDDVANESDDGALEIGRPPADLGLDLPPLSIVRPKPGHLALFPSTLYHGTRPFRGGRRLTVAFDLSPCRTSRA